jgi:hypothetical protein
MTWFKVDDGFWSHPKTLALPPSAVALWVRAGSYCGKHLTDGFVSRAILPMLQGTEGDALELVHSGLWKPVDGGWAFHDWDAYQDTKEAVERRRVAWKERAKRHRSNDDENTPSSSIHSIPFHSPVSRDSRRDSTRDSRRESRRDTPRDTGPTPTPPAYRDAIAHLETLIAKETTP